MGKQLNEIFSGNGNQILVVTVDQLKEFASAIISECKEQFTVVPATTVEVINSTEEKEHYYNAKEVCEKLKVSNVTLWRWEKNKYLLPIKVGSKRLYNATMIDNFLVSNNKPSFDE